LLDKEKKLGIREFLDILAGETSYITQNTSLKNL